MESRLIAISLVVLIAPSSGCGGRPCKKACNKILHCSGIDGGAKAGSNDQSCSFSERCDIQESCRARCILEASCETLTGKDPQGLQDLKSCEQQCDEKAVDGTVFKLPDLGPPPDTKVCKPSCEGRECGNNGCGGSCGTCEHQMVCVQGIGSRCMPDTPPECYEINECQYEGQKKCTGPDSFRSCTYETMGCLVWDGST